jgi:hypothetical protein
VSKAHKEVPANENAAPCPLFRIFPRAPSPCADHKASGHLELEPVNREVRPFDRFLNVIALIFSSVNPGSSASIRRGDDVQWGPRENGTSNTSSL